MKIPGILALTLAAAAVQAAPTVYIPTGTGNVVVAVDAATDTVTATYTGVENSHGLVATPDGEYLVAGSLSETPLKPGQPKNTANSQLFFIHPAHGHVMSTIPVAGWSHHLAITPDGRYVLAAHGARGTMGVVDLQSNTETRTVPTGRVPNFILVTRDGRRAYVSNTGGNDIAEVDLTTWKVTRRLEGGPAPTHMAFSRDEKKIYVGNAAAGKVSEVDVASGKISRSFRIGKGVHGVDVSDDGRTLFVTSQQEQKLVAVDLATGAERAIALKPAPYHLNTIHGAGKVYVSSAREPTVWVVDQKTFKVTGTFKLPAGQGHQMAVVP